VNVCDPTEDKWCDANILNVRAPADATVVFRCGTPTENKSVNTRDKFFFLGGGGGMCFTYIPRVSHKYFVQRFQCSIKEISYFQIDNYEQEFT
jgi:hypothetical protein